MRHCKKTFKLGRTSSHIRCMMANLLKPLIDEESITTTVAKAKELRRHADHLITLAKKNTLASRRQAIAELMVRFNRRSDKEAREVRNQKAQHANIDRGVISKLFDTLGPRFKNRDGGYTRIIRIGRRVGDKSETCIVEYLEG